MARSTSARCTSIRFWEARMKANASARLSPESTGFLSITGSLLPTFSVRQPSASERLDLLAQLVELNLKAVSCRRGAIGGLRLVREPTGRELGRQPPAPRLADHARDSHDDREHRPDPLEVEEHRRAERDTWQATRRPFDERDRDDGGDDDDHGSTEPHRSTVRVRAHGGAPQPAAGTELMHSLDNVVSEKGDAMHRVQRDGTGAAGAVSTVRRLARASRVALSGFREAEKVRGGHVERGGQLGNGRNSRLALGPLHAPDVVPMHSRAKTQFLLRHPAVDPNLP